MKNWFKRNKSEIIFGSIIGVIVIAATVFCILAIVNGWGDGSDFNTSTWTANPANPASPVHRVLFC